MLNQDMQIIRSNRAATRLFRRPITGRNIASVLRDPKLLDAVEQVIQHNEGAEIELSQSHPQHRDLWIRVDPLPRKEFADACVLIVLHDITARKRMEQMRVDFVADASHELRTPLASLSGFIETIQGPAKDDPEAQAQFLDIMAQQANRMSRLIDELLSLSRIELDSHNPPDTPVDIKAVLDAVQLALTPQAQDKNMTLKYVGAEALPEIVGDKDQLTQVFQNLIVNAIKYGHANAPITIDANVVEHVPHSADGAGLSGQSLRISVTDEGDGIAPEHLPRLTERFYRVDKARSRAVGGTGLGLAIVKHIVHRHQGALDIQSTRGQGSTFTVFLPLRMED
jgi:two-component system phosphate regulon sensor histidine kinase PhoR